MKYLVFLSQEFDAVSLFSFAAAWETREGSAMSLETRASTHRRSWVSSLAVAFFLILAGPVGAQAQTATVNWTDVHQVIDGFGATPNAGSGYADLTTAQQSFFFGTGSGQLGLSLLRVGVANGDMWPGDCSSISTSCAGTYVSDMQAMIANGGRIYASPWSPPAQYTTNDNTACTGGSGNGALITGDYASYATWLANFVQTLKTEDGITLTALSIQNEPDQCQGYGSALWTAADIDNFIKSNLGPTFASDGISTMIFMSENAGYGAITGANGGGTCGTDSSCTNYVSGYNWHDYDASLTGTNTVSADPYPSGWASGKKYWETEASAGSDYGPSFARGSFDPSMTDALNWAAIIDQRIAGDGANAWLYWLMLDTYDDNEGLEYDGTIASRAYVLGQYSAFVRPGYYRIDATHLPQTGVSVSAYQNPATSTLVIIATNYTDSAVSQTFNITNAPIFSSVTPTVTSATQSLATLSSVSLSGDSFSYALPAQSLTTFVGSTTAPSAPSNLSVKVVAR